MRYVVQPRGGAAGCEGRGILRQLPEKGAERRILVGGVNPGTARSFPVLNAREIGGTSGLSPGLRYARARSGPIAGDCSGGGIPPVRVQPGAAAEPRGVCPERFL